MEIKEPPLPPEITITKKQLKSDAVKIKELFRKRKKFMGSYYDVAPIKEPVMFFSRRNGKVEFYENVTSGMFEFTHSDGGTRFIIINTNDKEEYGFGNKSFKGYQAHEDYPLTGRPDPLLTSEQVNMIVEKSLTDIKKWKSQEIKAKSDMIWKVALGIALVIGAVALFRIIVPSTPPETERIIVQGINGTVPTILG